MNHNVLPEKWSVNERVIFEHILQRLWHDQWTSKLNMSKENKHKEYVGIFSHLNLYLFDKFMIRFLKLFQIISYIWTNLLFNKLLIIPNLLNIEHTIYYWKHIRYTIYLIHLKKLVSKSSRKFEYLEKFWVYKNN